MAHNYNLHYILNEILLLWLIMYIMNLRHICWSLVVLHIIISSQLILFHWISGSQTTIPSSLKNSKETAEWPTNPRQLVEDLHWSGGSGFHLHPLWVVASASFIPKLIPEDEFEAPFRFKKKNVVKQDTEWKRLYMEGQGLMAQVWECPLQNCQRWPLLETASEAGGWKMLEQNDQKHLRVYSAWYLFSWPYNWILSWQNMRNSSILHVAILVALHQVQSHPLQCGYHSCHCYQATLTQTFGANYAQHTPAV